MQIKRTYIYRYKEQDKTPLCIYLCNTQIKNKILIIPLTPDQSEHTYKLSVTRQHADLNNYKEIDKADITSQLFLNSKPVKISDNDIKFIQKYIIDNMIDKIGLDANKNNTSIELFESLYQFFKWKGQKLLLNVLPYEYKTTIYENGIYWAALGVNVGSELNKNRPVLIWKKRCNGANPANYSYVIIPITSKNRSKSYYMNVPIDINGRMCYLRIEDMRRINIKRITRPILTLDKKIIFIDDNKRLEIIEAIKKFFIFENRYKKS